MRILHCCLACFYIDNYSYQENILPRYHKKMGHDVRIIASTESFDKDGNITYVASGEYLNEDDILVVRLPYARYLPPKVARKIRRYKGLQEQLALYLPDFIFIHDIQFLDIDIICDYARNNTVRIVADCHADFSNSARNWFSRQILHGIVYKKCAQMINPYVEMFYGVLPARVDFLRNVYNLPYTKTQLLVMGAEDDKANASLKIEKKLQTRKKFDIDANDFVVVFGGKIDQAKRQVLLLMDAVNTLDDPSIKLIVFGSIIPEMKREVLYRCSDRVKYIGWATSDESYDYFAMGNIACFPGRHSVFWEQVVGMGIPLIVKKWEGTTHVNVCNNVVFLDQDNQKEIQDSILHIKTNYDYYKSNAIKSREAFMYGKIAEKCLNF